MTVEVGQSTANDASQTFAGNPNNTASCSMEQIYSPISINKYYNAVSPSFKTPITTDTGPFNDGKSVGPTVRELNPYFSSIFGDDGSTFIAFCDYNTVSHSPSDDLNLKKNTNRPRITDIRTQAFRGPMMLSGWGFDIGDLPVPAKEDEKKSFDPNLLNNRSYWKTGPINLMWDDERQVWSGGYHVVCGVLAPEEEISPPSSPTSPTTFKIRLFRRDVEKQKENNISPLAADQVEETITCVNRDPSLSYDGSRQSNVFIIAIRLNYEWLPLWVGCP